MKLTELHGGKLEVRSAPRRGTTVRFICLLAKSFGISTTLPKIQLEDSLQKRILRLVEPGHDCVPWRRFNADALEHSFQTESLTFSSVFGGMNTCDQSTILRIPIQGLKPALGFLYGVPVYIERAFRHLLGFFEHPGRYLLFGT